MYLILGEKNVIVVRYESCFHRVVTRMIMVTRGERALDSGEEKYKKLQRSYIREQMKKVRGCGGDKRSREELLRSGYSYFSSIVTR